MSGLGDPPRGAEELWPFLSTDVRRRLLRALPPLPEGSSYTDDTVQRAIDEAQGPQLGDRVWIKGWGAGPFLVAGRNGHTAALLRPDGSTRHDGPDDDQRWTRVPVEVLTDEPPPGPPASPWTPLLVVRLVSALAALACAAAALAVLR